MMHLLFYSVVVVFATFCASEKENPVPKHGIDSKQSATKGLSAADVEGILKTLSKLERDEDSDVKLKYSEPDKTRYTGERLLVSKGPAAETKSGKITGVAEEDKFSDKDVSLTESLYHMKIAGDIETYPYHKMASMMELPEKSVEEEKSHLAKDHLVDETYLKKVDEIGKSISKEEFTTHLADDNIEGHLKKDILADKSLDFDPKVDHPDEPYKYDLDKAMEDWKVSHSDLVKIQGGIFPEEGYKIETSHHLEKSKAHEDLSKNIKASSAIDEELKIDHAHTAEGSIVHEMNDEYAKKVKESLGLEKDLMMDGSHIAERGIAYKIDDELLKKLKGLSGFDEELKITGSHFEKGGIAHEMDEELVKKMKTSLEKGLRDEDKAYEISEELFKKVKSTPELYKEFKELSAAGDGVAHEMNEELLKKIISHADLDKEFKTEKAHYLGSGIAHEIDGGLLKKTKETLGFDKAQDELFHVSKELQKKESIAEGSSAYEKAIEQAYKDAHARTEEEELKKYLDELSGFDTKKAVHGKELMFEKDMTAEKTHEINTKIGLDKSLEYGKEKTVFGSKIPVEKEIKHVLGHDIYAEDGKAIKIYEDELLKKEKSYEAGSHIFATEADKNFKIHEDKHAFDESLGFGKEKAVFGTKIPVEEGLKHAEGHDIYAAEADKNFKIKEEKHAFDEALGFGKEKPVFGSKEGIKHAIGSDIYAAEADKKFKVHEDKHAFDEALGFGKEKAVFESKEGVKHTVDHDIYAAEIDKAFKFHEDEMLKKEKAYEAGSHIHKDKEVLDSGTKHIESGKEHKDLKTKLIELLRRVLHIRKCHLVTMRPGELLGIVRCISSSKNF